jgi:hypothetical protein
VSVLLLRKCRVNPRQKYLFQSLCQRYGHMYRCMMPDNCRLSQVDEATMHATTLYDCTVSGLLKGEKGSGLGTETGRPAAVIGSCS